jgi:betaine-aldehyde dehydrogenase
VQFVDGQPAEGSGLEQLTVTNPATSDVLETYRVVSDDEGIGLANDTTYGLAASAWTRDLHRGLRASRDIRSGTVWLNDHIFLTSEMPHGGVKQSGFDKDLSTYSFDEYTTVKHVMLDITGDARREWHRTIFTDTPEGTAVP